MREQRFTRKKKRKSRIDVIAKMLIRGGDLLNTVPLEPGSCNAATKTALERLKQARVGDTAVSK